MSKHNIVIVGGGFGGIKAALELTDDRRFHVTLLSDQADFRFYPTLFRTATGGRRMISSIPLSEIFAGKSVHIVNDSIKSLDRQERRLKTTKGHGFTYDGLILALGTQTNYYGIKGLDRYSYGIKSVDDAERLKRHLHAQLIDQKHPDLNYVVVGGGPSGVELAGVLPSYLREICKRHGIQHPDIHVDLIEAAPRLLPRMPKAFSWSVMKHLKKLKVRLYLHQQVKAETAEALVVKGRRIISHTVIWTAGVKNHPFFINQNFQLADNGKARVDQFLQSEPGLYVLGDNADTPYSGLAQTALYDGTFVANNLKRLAAGLEPKPYQAVKPIYVIPVGPHWSAVLWGRVQIYGSLGWLLRRAADLVAYHDYEPFQQATHRWIAEKDSEELCPICHSL